MGVMDGTWILEARQGYAVVMALLISSNNSTVEAIAETFGSVFRASLMGLGIRVRSDVKK